MWQWAASATTYLSSDGKSLFCLEDSLQDVDNGQSRQHTVHTTAPLRAGPEWTKTALASMINNLTTKYELIGMARPTRISQDTIEGPSKLRL